MEHEDILYIREEEIQSYFLYALVSLGFAPGEEEMEAITEIVFDFLLDKGIIDDIEEE